MARNTLTDLALQASRLSGIARTLVTALSRSDRLIATGLISVFLAVVLGLPVHLPIQAASWLTFMALVITPGYLLGEIVAWHLNLDWLERLALALPLGVSAMALPGMVTLLGHKTIQDLAVGWTLTVGLIIIAWLFHRRWGRKNSPHRPSPWAWDEIIMLLLLAASFVYMFPTLSLYKMDGDAYSFVSFTSDALTGAPMNVTEPLLGTGKGPGARMAFNQLLPIYHLWSYMPKVDHIELTATASRSMIALWAVLASYMLGKAAGYGNRRFGLLAASIQVLIYLAAPFLRSDHVSIFFFERINADKFTVTVTMLPVVFALSIRYVRQGRRDAWIAAAIATFAVSTIHALIAAMLALALAAFGGLHLLLNLRHRDAWVRVIGLAILVGIVMFLPFTQLFIARGSDPLSSTYPSSFEGWSIGEKLTPALPFFMMRNMDVYGPLPNLAHLDADQANTDASPFLIWRFAVNMRRRRIILFDLNHYISDPSLILEPPYLLSLLILPLLLWRLRSSLGAQFALGTSLAVLFVMFNPILTPMLGAMVIPWILWRFVWLLPYALTLALVTQRLLTLLVKVLTRLPKLGPARGALLANAPLGFVVVAGLLLRPSIIANIEEIHARTAGPVAYGTPKNILARLEEETSHSGPVIVLADQNLSVTIPAYVGNADVLAHRVLTTSELFPADEQDQALQRHIDQYNFLHTSFLTAASVDILQQNDIRYVIVSSGSDLGVQLRLSPQWFEWLVDDQSYSLYAVREMPTVTASIQGNTAMVGCQWEVAQQHYQTALEQDPSDLLALLGLAESYRIEGQFDLALTTLQQAAAQVESPVLHYRLGQLYADMGQVERSIAEFDRAQRGDPFVSRFHMALGDACLSAGQNDCAKEQYEAAVATQELPDESWRLIALADLWQERGNADLALTLYEQAAAIKPDEYTQLVLASVYQRMEQFDKAEALLQILQEKRPLSARVVSEMAELMAVKNETDQAVALYRHAMWLQALQAQDALFTRLVLAQVLLEANRLDEARSEIEHALTLQPHSASAYMLLGDLYREQNRPDMAMATYQHVLQLDPTQVAAYTSLNDQYRQQAIPPDETLALLEMAAEVNPEQVVLFLSLGNQLQRYGDVETAIITYQLALDLLEPNILSLRLRQRSAERNRALAYSRLAALYEDIGQLETAMSYYHAAVAAAPTESWTRVLLGDALRRRNDAAAAETTYRRVIQTDPTYVVAYLRLANLLSSRGDTGTASELHQQALQATSSESDPRQRSRAWLGLGSFYSQSRQPDILLGSDEEQIPATDLSDPITQKALNAYTQALAADENLAAVHALARLYQEIGQTDQAIQLYQQRIQRGEQDNWSPTILSRYYNGLGNVYLIGRQFDQAIHSYQQAIDLDGWWPAARLGLAQALSEKGDQEGALAELQQAVEVVPGSVEAQIALANALDQQGDKEQALAIYQATAQARPGNTSANLALARALQERNRWDEAEQSYRQAIDMNAGSAEAYVRLANLYIIRARYAEAESLLGQAIQLDRNYARAYIRMGELKVRLGHYSEALTFYEQALQVEPTDWRAYSALAGIQRLLGRIDQAIGNLRESAAMDHTASAPLLELASIYREQNQPDLAEGLLLLALERSPGDIAVRQALAEYYQSMALGDEALTQLRLAVKENPDSMETLVSLANQLRLQGRDEEAQTLYQQAAQAQEPSSAGYRALAIARQTQGRWEEALALVEQAVAYAPDEPMNWIVKGQLQAQLGNEEAALASLQQATQLSPAQGQTWQALGSHLRSIGEARQAIVALQEAIAVESTYLPAYESLIQTYQELGQDDQVARTVALARQAVPGSYLADIYAARSLEDQLLWDEARAALNQAIAKAPGVPDPLTVMGGLEGLQGDTDQAIVWYERAVNLRPGDQTANRDLIDLLLRLDNNDRALAQAEQALENRPGDSDLLLRWGKIQRALGQFAEAESAFLKAAHLNRADSSPYSELAALYVAQGKPEAAVIAYQQAIALRPDQETYYAGLSQAWSMQGQLDQALTVLEDALSKVSRPTPLYAAMSNLYLLRGEPHLAVATLQKAIQEIGEDRQFLQALASCYRSQAQFDLAEQVYRRMLALYPDEAADHMALADLYLDRGRTAAALAQYRQALALEPSSPAVHLALGETYREVGRSGLAAYYFQQAVRLEPASPDGYLALADLYLAEGLPREAERYTRLSLEVSPHNPSSYISLGNVYRSLGDISAAERNYRSAINLDAVRPNGYLALADLYVARHQYAEAVAAHQQAIRQAPLDWSLWLSLGNVYAEMGEYDSTMSAFAQAADIDPAVPDPWLRKGDIYLTQGNRGDALASYEYARALRPSEAKPLLRLADFFEQQDNPDEAERYARQAIAANPFDAAGYITLGRLLTNKAESDEAIDNLMAAIQRDPRQFVCYQSWIWLHIDIKRRPYRLDMTRLQDALTEIAEGPDSETLWAHVMLGLGYSRLEGATDRAIGHLEEANLLDPVYGELYQELALAYEERLDGRLALAAWYRYLYATAVRSDTSVAQAHADWLLQTHIEQPADGAWVTGSVEIVGTATSENFQFYKLEFSAVESPDIRYAVGEPVYQPVEHGQLMTWPTTGLAPGNYRLRMTVVDITGNNGPYDEITIRIRGQR